MGRGAVGPPSRYSRSVAANIDRLRKEAGLAVGEFVSRAGLTRSYYQSRASLQLPFNTNDIDALATVLGVAPAELAAPAALPESEVRVPVAEVSRRVRRLLDSQGATDADLLAHLNGIDPHFTGSVGELLRSTAGAAAVPESALKAIAQWADVHPGYLTDVSDDAIADRTDAELELRDVMKEVGASSIRFRALGEMSPDALRAIARSLRARPATT